MIGDLSYEEFAAQWGCNPVYDKSPRLPAMSINLVRKSFAAAIQRTIAGTENMEDREDLLDLLH
jgi:hypothetical protein